MPVTHLCSKEPPRYSPLLSIRSCGKWFTSGQSLFCCAHPFSRTPFCTSLTQKMPLAHIYCHDSPQKSTFALKEAENRQPWVINGHNTHTPDSRDACQAIAFYDNFTPEKSRPIKMNRYRLHESSSTRGIERTPAGFHHPRCLALGGIQNHVCVWNMRINII